MSVSQGTTQATGQDIIDELEFQYTSGASKASLPCFLSLCAPFYLSLVAYAVRPPSFPHPARTLFLLAMPCLALL